MKSENLDEEASKMEHDVAPFDSLINLEISDILTPIACAILVNEIFQGLLYQKCQIPYSYHRLKTIVNKKREKTNSNEIPRQINYNVSNHFRVVSTAYDILESIMKGVVKEFTTKGDRIKEVVFVFGTTPQCPKEIYTVKICSLAKGHTERNHAKPMCKYRQKLLRDIFLSQRWLNAVDNSMACTNTFVYLKQTAACSNSDDFFLPSKPLVFSSKVKHVRINFDFEQSEKRNCCDNVSVFEDAGTNSTLIEEQSSDSNDTESITWYQAKDLFKGFKDCYVNKVSASELW